NILLKKAEPMPLASQSAQNRTIRGCVPVAPRRGDGQAEDRDLQSALLPSLPEAEWTTNGSRGRKKRPKKVLTFLRWAEYDFGWLKGTFAMHMMWCNSSAEVPHA